MAAMFFQGTLGSALTYSVFHGSASRPGPQGQPPGSWVVKVEFPLKRLELITNQMLRAADSPDHAFLAINHHSIRMRLNPAPALKGPNCV